MPARTLVLGSSLVLALSACTDYSQLAFTTNDRISFRVPEARSQVSLPVALRWHDSRPRAGERYGVFVDRSPVRPGHELREVAARDVACSRTPGCPDSVYLSDRGVYLTARPSLTLTKLAPLRGGRAREQLHEVIIVIVDASGRRVGESAWFVHFTLASRAVG